MNLRRKLLTVFGALALLSLVTAAVTLWTISSWTRTSTATENHYQRSLLLQRIRASTFRAFKEVPDAVTGDDPDSDVEFDEYIQPAKEDFEIWARLAEDDAEREQVRQIREAFEVLEATAKETFALVKQNRFKEASVLMEGKLEDNDFENFNRLSAEAVASDRAKREVIRATNENTRRTARIVLAVVAFGTISLVLLLAAYLASDLFKPLEELKQALKRTAEGDYNQELHDSREDEFGAVNRAFNQMVKTIARRVKLAGDGGEDAENAELGFNSFTSKMTIHKLVAQMRLRIMELDSKLNQTKTKIAEDKEEDAPQAEKIDLDALVENLENLSQAITRVIDFSFPLDITLSKTDVRALLYDALLRFHDELSARGISFELEVDREVKYATLDHLKIREAVSELIRNALKALPDAGGKIGLRARLKDTDLLIEVADNGAGADNLSLDEIDIKRRRDYRTGLRLTKAIVEQHGGKMKINSESGEGTFVQMSLPLRLEA
ncbi:MAG: HAMP domain-containing histidine kinase [Acidobacteria bacterium]|nr:HAMP domain-containing histidine kinase [Acidobacteriota bacterium]MCA1636749.1 HAMP domain-containing histidine kinase [Acidobacteriota bacterium]